MKKRIIKNIFSISFILIFLILAIGSGENSKSEENNSKPSTTQEPKAKTETYQSTSAICDYCGKTFYKNSGYMLTGHSEVFCSKTCCTNWGWMNDIGVN